MKIRPSHNAETLQKVHINERETSEIDPDRVGSIGASGVTVPNPSEPSEFAVHLQNAIGGTRESAPVILPGERVSLMAVTLPVRGIRAKRAALPFALEDRVSAPIEDVHVALCRSLDKGDQVLAAVVDRRVMADAMTSDDRRILPEHFALPTPAAIDGAPAWAVWRSGGRALVRVSDGTGFIIDVTMLPLIWQQASRPSVTAYGEALPDTVTPASHQGTPPLPDPRDLASDLRQGMFRHTSANGARQLKRVAAVLAVGLIGHLGIAVADTVALARIADRERAAAQAAIDPILPGIVVSPDIQPILSRLAPPATTSSGSAFLPLLTAVSATLLETGNPVTVRRLAFADNPSRLTLLVEAPTLDALQQAERALRAGSLTVTTGAATATAGVAEAEFAITWGAVK